MHDADVYRADSDSDGGDSDVDGDALPLGALPPPLPPTATGTDAVHDAPVYANAAVAAAVEAWTPPDYPPDVVPTIGIFSAGAEAERINDLMAMARNTANVHTRRAMEEEARRRGRVLLAQLCRGHCVPVASLMNIAESTIRCFEILGVDTIGPADFGALEAQLMRVQADVDGVTIVLRKALRTEADLGALARVLAVFGRHMQTVRSVHHSAAVGDPDALRGRLAAIGESCESIEAATDRDQAPVINFLVQTMLDNDLFVDDEGYVCVSEKFCTKVQQTDPHTGATTHVERLYDTLVFTHLRRNDYKARPMTVEAFLMSIAVTDVTQLSEYNACFMDPAHFGPSASRRLRLRVDPATAAEAATILFREVPVGKTDSADGRCHAVGVKIRAIVVSRCLSQNLLPRVPQREHGTVALSFANGVFLAHASPEFARKHLGGRNTPYFWRYDDPKLPRTELLSRVFVTAVVQGGGVEPVAMPFDEYMVHLARGVLGPEASALGAFDHRTFRRAATPQEANRARDAARWIREQLDRAGEPYTLEGVQRAFGRTAQATAAARARLDACGPATGEPWLAHWHSIWDKQGIAGEHLRFHVAWFLSQVVLYEPTRARALTIIRGATNAGKTAYLRALARLVAADRVKKLAVPNDPTFPLSSLANGDEYDLIITEDTSPRSTGIPFSYFAGVVDGCLTTSVRNKGEGTSDIIARWLMATNSPALDFIIENEKLAGYRRILPEEFSATIMVENTAEVQRLMHSELGAFVLFAITEYYARYDAFTTKMLADKGFEPAHVTALRNKIIRECDPIARVLGGIGFHIDQADESCCTPLQDLVLAVSRCLYQARTGRSGDPGATPMSGGAGAYVGASGGLVSTENVVLRLTSVFGLKVSYCERPVGGVPVTTQFALGIRPAREGDGASQSQNMATVVEFLRTAPFVLHPMHAVVYCRGAIMSVPELDDAFRLWAGHNNRSAGSIVAPSVDILVAIFDGANEGVGSRSEEEEDAAYADAAAAIEDQVEDARAAEEGAVHSSDDGGEGPEEEGGAGEEEEGAMEPHGAVAAHDAADTPSRTAPRRALPPVFGAALPIEGGAGDGPFVLDGRECIVQVLNGPLRDVAANAPIRIVQDADDGSAALAVHNLSFLGPVGAYALYVLTQALVHRTPAAGHAPILRRAVVPVSQAARDRAAAEVRRRGEDVPVAIRPSQPGVPPAYTINALPLERFCFEASRYAQILLHTRQPPPLHPEECAHRRDELARVLADVNAALGLEESCARLALVSTEDGFAIANLAAPRRRRPARRGGAGGANVTPRTASSSETTPRTPARRRQRRAEDDGAAPVPKRQRRLRAEDVGEGEEEESDY